MHASGNRKPTLLTPANSAGNKKLTHGTADRLIFKTDFNRDSSVVPQNIHLLK